jgi:MFS family permease
VGGALVDGLGWRAIFWMNVPVTTTALLLASRHIAESRAPRSRRADVPGQLLAVGFVGCATAALIQAPAVGWGSGQTLALLAAAATALGAFVAVELRRAEPLLDVRLFRRGALAGATAVAALAYLALMGFLFLNTLYLQQVRGLSPLQAGIATLPCPLGLLVVGPLSGRITARLGPRPPIVLGGLGVAAGSLMLLLVTPTVPVAACLLMGLAWGMVNPPITDAAVSAMPRQHAGVASAVTGTARQIGAVTGVALLGSLAATRSHALAAARVAGPPVVRSAFAGATRTSYLVAAAAGLLVALLGATLMRTDRRIRTTELSTGGQSCAF